MTPRHLMLPTTTPVAGFASSGGRNSMGGGGSRAEYDFFSPLVSSVGNGVADRRDTMTTDDDRDMERLEHHDTVEHDLRLLSQPSQQSDASMVGGVGGHSHSHGHLMDMDVSLMEDDDGEVMEDDDGDMDIDMESILSSGSEDEDDDEEDEDEEDGFDDDDEVLCCALYFFSCNNYLV